MASAFFGNKVNIGIDFHDTFSYEPDFFVGLLRSWPGDVYIITGTPPSKLHEIKEALTKLGVQESEYKKILMGYEYDKDHMSLAHFKKMAHHKLKLIRQYKIQVYFDDNPFYVSYIKDHNVLALQPIVSEKYLKAFEKTDPFFTCNLQKMQFDYLKDLTDDTLLKKKS